MAKKEILGDHKRVGKKLIPPLMQDGYLKEINWINDSVPEVLWITILQKRLGIERAAEVTSEIHKEYLEKCDGKFLQSFISSYESLDHNSKQEIKRKFDNSILLSDLQCGLEPLTACFPDHPLEFLFRSQKLLPLEIAKKELKACLHDLLDKRSKVASWTQAGVIFNSMAAGKFNAPKDSAIWKLNELQNYPNTDISKQVASNIRAMINIFTAADMRNSACKWTTTFWQNAFILEPPYVKLNR